MSYHDNIPEAKRMPLPGQVWQHYNGATYRILIIANTEGDDESKREKYPPTVVYQAIHLALGDIGKTWARSLSDWHRSMHYLLENAEGGTDASR